MEDKIMIIKIGGGASINLEGIIEGLKGINKRCIIVHGANSLRDELAEKTGYTKNVVTSLSGYSSVVSDQELIDLQMMAYAGIRNKRIVELCQQKAINAIGLCGLDGRLIQGRRNKGIKIMENGKKKILRDFSGKPDKINIKLLHSLLDQGYMPVLTVPIIDENGYAINSENDDIVSLLQKSLKSETVVHLIEAKGFLKDPYNENMVVKRMNREELTTWEAESKGRIKRKLYSLKKMFENEVKRVIIADGRIEKPLEGAFAFVGTVIE